MSYNRMSKRASALAVLVVAVVGVALSQSADKEGQGTVQVSEPTPMRTSIPLTPSDRIGSADEKGSPDPSRRPSSTPPVGPSRRLRISGIVSTWYCNADSSRAKLSRCTRESPDNLDTNLYAAISPDLARLRGRAVTVCLSSDPSRCVQVRVIDCNCQATQAIDLYADAFIQLTPLSHGRISVVIHA